jgi:hypothetical protein
MKDLAPPVLMLNGIPISLRTWQLLFTPIHRLMALRQPKP